MSSQERQTTSGRLVEYEEANAAVDRLSRKDCVLVKFGKVGDKTMLEYRKFVLADQSNAETIELIDNCVKLRDKNKSRICTTFEMKTAVHLNVSQ